MPKPQNQSFLQAKIKPKNKFSLCFSLNSAFLRKIYVNILRQKGICYEKRYRKFKKYKKV